MSIPLHNLYDFIHQVTEKKFVIKYFYPFGSKDLKNVANLYLHEATLEEVAKKYYQNTVFIKENLHELFDQTSLNWTNYQPILFCHDQEPLHFNLYRTSSIDNEFLLKWQRHYKNYKYHNEPLNLRHQHPTSMQKYWILLHSELNSEELIRYENSELFIGAYWWSHALIARDWYRYAEYDKRLSEKNATNLFLVYCRDTSGSRHYRKNFLNFLQDYQINEYCWFGNGGNSDDSATYNIHDITSTSIHVVLETVFDQRIHLTEKTLRPIACGQPFIIANGPDTLEYLKTYGFKTFSPWINESYDQKKDNQERLKAIAKEMKRLSDLSENELNIVITECNKIAEHNKKIFFSKKFFNQVINELKTNVNQAMVKSNNTLDWRTMWWNHNRRKLYNPDPLWEKRRPYMLHLIRHLKKGGTLKDYVPPDLD